MKKPGRPLEYDLEEVLEIAMHLFWRNGYEATTLQDLLNATNLTKSSFYYAFGNKYQLFEQCLVRYRERQVAQMQLELRQAATGRIFVENFLHQLVDATDVSERQQGCFVMNMATEFAGRNPVGSGAVTNASIRLTKVFQSAIERGQAEGVIPEQKNSEALAYFLFNCITGLRTMIKAKVDPVKINAIVAITLTSFE